METSFHYDLADKQLAFKLREKLTSKPGLEMKGNGWFNTVTGKLSYVGTCKAQVKIGKDVKDAGSSPLKLGVGVRVVGADVKNQPKPQIHMAAKKGISLFDGPRTVLTAKAWADVDPQTQKFTARNATLKLSHKWLGFTKRQDIKLSAGLDVSWAPGAREPKATPFGVVRENNWALHYRANRTYLTYDL
eukprot:CAMPEP_0202861266 /NCGR_PEP_ID=MMETSP1391-20130828/2726_1 /ASSEMBLY_ACC=CAM_ASM_000867 /TAXON_ID=1034604 /ORGANISM="Chlamydomonas leiostraca, Strain SAG 11-49" /LENGTH=188 /DNA_ID=CAMNT_0049540633 /DNA_START=32 /DNA_END=598 /DNA_ORIENTATION=-